jgi:hypothetical protein
MSIFLTTIEKFVSWSGGIFKYLPSLLNKPQTFYIIQNMWLFVYGSHNLH